MKIVLLHESCSTKGYRLLLFRQHVRKENKIMGVSLLCLFHLALQNHRTMVTLLLAIHF